MQHTSKVMKIIGAITLVAGIGAALHLTRHSEPLQVVIPPDGLIQIDSAAKPEDLETWVLQRCHEDTIPSFDRTLATVTEDQMAGLQNGLRQCKSDTKIRQLNLHGRTSWMATSRALELARAAKVDVGLHESAPISDDGLKVMQACIRPAMNTHTEDGARPMRMELTRKNATRLYCGLPTSDEITSIILSARRPPKSIFAFG